MPHVSHVSANQEKSFLFHRIIISEKEKAFLFVFNSYWKSLIGPLEKFIRGVFLLGENGCKEINSD